MNEIKYEIWHSENSNLLVESRDIIRGVYNDAGAIVTGFTREKWLSLSDEEREEDAQTPKYIFSDENQTIILEGEIYDNYAALLADILEDFVCTRVDGKIVWRGDDYDEVEIMDEMVRMTDVGQVSQEFAGETTDGKVMVAIYSKYTDVRDSASLMTRTEFNDYCIERGWRNPFAKEITIKDYASTHNKEISSVRQKALRGGFKTARKVGRDWLINEFEPYQDLRKKED